MIARLVAPYTRVQFFKDYWESQPLLVSRDETPWYEDLVKLIHVDEIIQLTTRQSSELRLVRARGTRVETYPVETDARGVPAIASLSAGYHDGYTVIVNALDRRWGPISRFAAALSDDIGHPIGVNLYLTPKDAQGFQPHVDGHDVFILQIEGEKSWEVYGNPIELPLEDQRTSFEVDKLGPPKLEATLTAGDMLYIPRGFVHKGMTSTRSSLHLTVGVHAWRWVDLLHRAIDVMAQENVEARRCTPSEWSAKQLHVRLQSLLETVANEHTAALAVESYQRAKVRESSSAPGGQFVALDEVDDLEMSSVLVRRAGLRFRIEANDKEVILHFGQNRLSGPVAITPAFQFLVSQESFCVQDLPDSFSEGSKLVLSRRLIREGIVSRLSQEKINGRRKIAEQG